MKKYGNNLDISKAIENTDICIELLKEKFEYTSDINKECTGYWLLSDGTILDSKAHGNIDKFLIEKGYIVNNSDNFDIYDGSQFMDYLNAVRIRNEVPHFRYSAYLTLPENNLTSIQYRIVNKWLEDILLNIKTYLVIDNGFQSKRYGILEEDKAKEDIRNYYRVGEFL